MRLASSVRHAKDRRVERGKIDGQSEAEHQADRDLHGAEFPSGLHGRAARSAGTTARYDRASRRTAPQAAAGRGWSCTTIVDGEAMTKEDAMFIARSYAVENDIPVIYECHAA